MRTSSQALPPADREVWVNPTTKLKIIGTTFSFSHAMLAKRLGVARTTVGTYFSRGNTAPSGVKVTALLNSINEEFGIEIPFAWVYDGQPGPVPGVPTRGVTSQAAERKAIVSRLAVEKSLESLEASRQASGLGYTATAVLRLQDAVGILLSALVLSSAVSE